MRECQNHLNLNYAFGPFILKPAEHELLRDGQPISLTPKTFDTLVVLVENCGRLLEKEELIQAVWHDTFVEEGNLCVTVSHLRKAFGNEHTYIKTVSKHGYRFVAEINVVPAETSTVRQQDPKAVPAMHGAILDRANNTMPFLRKFRLPSLAAVSLVGGILLAIGVWLKVGTTIHATKTLEIRSLAVLPFEILGAKADDEYLGLGMADALITKLGTIGQIVTRPTRATQKYQNTSQDPRSVGREQSVDAVLDGRIQRSGDRVRVTAQLTRVADGMQLWADTFDEEFTNMFAVEDAVSAQVATSIRLELTGAQKERLAKRSTASSEAYQSYLRGRYFWNERTGEGLRKGLDYFRHAIDLDPTYAEAYAGMADSYAMLGLYTALPPNEAFPKAKAAAIEALKLDSALAEAHATLGFVHFYYDWDGAAADKEFATALQENPNYAMAHSWRGFNLAVTGRLPEAITEARLAQEADPLSAIVGTNAAWVYFLARRSDQAVEIVQKVIEIDPNFPRAHFRLGNIYENEGEYHGAIAEYEKAVHLSDGDTYYQASLGHAYAMSGMVAEAEKCLQHLEQLSTRRYVPPYAIALIYVGMGNKNRGLEWLERAHVDRSTSMAYLRVEPALDSLRSEPRFTRLVQQTNF
jgi:TolB-like protein/DNA-binding winged helix-turn-helix (wHTH) protein/tetratricopeptide (TPR) repeat protein